MSWWGKVLGGAFGFVLGGPLGALLGAALGHTLDQGVARLALEGGIGPADRERIQTAFFTATFSVMGHVAKADGRVSEDEIAAARAIMDHMDLAAELRRTAINLFNQGKRADFPLDEVLDQFIKECQGRRSLLRMFIEIQLSAAYADGLMHEQERALLLHICERLGLSRFEFAQLEALIKAQARGAGAGPRAPRGADTLRGAYTLLGVSPQSSDDEIKGAYRRLMSRHHPDKLVAKGLPEEMMKLATEKTAQISAAYEQIRAARGL